MKLRAIALASVATLMFSSPAFAQDPGWYLGLGAGYDHLNNQKLVFRAGPPPFASVKFSDNALYLASGGYKFDSGWRFELEFSFDEHRASRFSCPVAPCPFKPAKSGTSNSSVFLNGAYDFPLGEYWGLTLGAGVGASDINEYIK